MWRRLYDAEWERRRLHRLSGHFVQQPVLSPIREEPRTEEAERAGEEATEEEPLPPLLVERVPRRVMQDEPEEYYDELEKKIKAYLKKKSNQPTTGKSFTDIHDSYDFSQLIEVPSETNDTMNKAFAVDVSEPTQREDSSERAGSKSSDTQFCEDVDVENMSKSKEIDDNVTQRKPYNVILTDDDSEKSQKSFSRGIIGDIKETDARHENIDDEVNIETQDEPSDGNETQTSKDEDANDNVSSATSTIITSAIQPIRCLTRIDEGANKEDASEAQVEQPKKSIFAENFEKNEDDELVRGSNENDSCGVQNIESEQKSRKKSGSEGAETNQDGEEEEYVEELEYSEKYHGEEEETECNREIEEKQDSLHRSEDKNSEEQRESEIEDEGNEESENCDSGQDDESDEEVEAMRGPDASSAMGRGSLQRDARPLPRPATASPRLGDAPDTAPAPMELEPVDASPEHFRQLRRSSTQLRLPRVSDAAVFENENGGHNSNRIGRKRSHRDPTFGTASADKRGRVEREGRTTADAATQTEERASVGVQTDRTTRLGGPAGSDDTSWSSASGASIHFRRFRRGRRFTLIFF